ncbi:sensor domain-containing phosphodiesterase [Paucidesulfovibrio longus]|uniref:sensor domain-containing phosphodiesterase n=1 Tax=Paucidesulfovibrio longus TaxID=889 RepID=UPI0003FBD1D4|nr:EAL domain-containing protein [Paucidesulfovibrio longus]
MRLSNIFFMDPPTPGYFLLPLGGQTRYILAMNDLQRPQAAVPSDEPTHCVPQDIEDILSKGEVQTFFQPLVSVSDRGVLGFEAYARGVVSDRNAIIKPQVLFDACHSLDTQLKIDRICRQSALEKFQGIYAKHKNILLFLNVNATALKSDQTKLGSLESEVQKLGYNPKHVIIELQANSITIEDHGKFLDRYRDGGFAFCLDDFHSADLEKLHLVRPSFVKLGRESFTRLAEVSYQRELLTSLRRFAGDMGCRVAAKGVETQEEAFLLLDNHIQLQQGFFFTKKKEDTGQDASQIFQEKIQELHSRYKERVGQSIREKKLLFEGYNQTMVRILARFEKTALRQYAEAAQNALASAPEALAVFILDEHGREVGSRLVRVPSQDGKTVLREVRGAQDHSIEDYFLHLQMGFERYVTHPFISPLDRKRHCLISRRFFNVEGRSLVLCVEFPASSASD